MGLDGEGQKIKTANFLDISAAFGLGNGLRAFKKIYQSSFVIKSPKRCGQAAILSDLGLLHMPVKNLVYIFPFFSFDRMKILPKNLQIDRSSSLSRYLPKTKTKQNKKLHRICASKVKKNSNNKNSVKTKCGIKSSYIYPVKNSDGKHV